MRQRNYIEGRTLGPWKPPAGDFDYEMHGGGYATKRRADPRIAALVHGALGDALTVINVGAGAGSYEPRDRYVVASPSTNGPTSMPVCASCAAWHRGLS